MDLVRPAATRFATSFLSLKSLVKHKQALRSLFTSQAWNGNKLAKTQAGLNVQEQDIILSTEWWHAVEDCLRASAPLLIVLRLVDGDEVPAMPEIAALMKYAKERINQGFPQQNKQPLLKKIMNIVDKHWETQMDHPLYGAALFLNPGKFFSIVKSVDWWRSYGGRAIELQRFAKRIVSLCASSSGYERNWSTFEFIHTKKRNRLQHQRLNDNVFVKYNRNNMDRFQKRREKIGDKSFDPLVIEDFDWGNEWVDPTVPPPQGARGCPDDISWDLVDEAMGATSSLQGRNYPRTTTMGRGPSNVNVQYERQRKRMAPTSPLFDEDDQDEGQEQHSSIPDGENDDSDFVHDDDDVTDDDEDPTSADQEGGEDTNATMDEFDDGY
ncbi:hypothetical protein ACQ4PT_042490 [Festuca glaucescens]